MQKPLAVGPSGAPSIGPRDIDRLAAISDREAGISLGQDKVEFLINRLGRRISALGFNGFTPYCDLLEQPGSNAERRAFIEAITTHTTSFFREKLQYDWMLQSGFRELWNIGAGHSRHMAIWSAACSTGQELYSALIASQHARARNFPGMRFRGIGTDLSRRVVQKAETAVYVEEEIAGIPREMRPSCLLTSKSGDGRYRIVPELRRLTEWRTANLTAIGTLAGIEADIIMLRNVLIYFDEETQNRVIANVLSCLRPGGYLLTGHSETAHPRTHGLDVIRPTIYRKPI